MSASLASECSRRQSFGFNIPQYCIVTTTLFPLIKDRVCQHDNNRKVIGISKIGGNLAGIEVAVLWR